ncbi:hypothetical protein [Alloactinosynnema sp. L-07]|nr:hypothetical protein [Alloactinosynnema sp. L-07]
MALLSAALDAVSAERDSVVAEMVAEPGATERSVAAALNITYGRVGQLTRRARQHSPARVH